MRRSIRTWCCSTDAARVVSTSRSATRIARACSSSRAAANARTAKVLQVVRLIPRLAPAACAALLSVDLTSERVERAPYPLTAARLGGVSVAVELLASAIGGPLDALSPENPLVFAPGPFAGTAVPAAAKHAGDT